MTTDNLQAAIREAVSGTGDSFLVLIVPTARVRDLFGDSAPARQSYAADFTVAQYKEQFEPDLSESRIRELCAAKALPDTTTEDGRTVPGAYKDSAGNWRITREGIVARQQAEREEGLRKRAEAESAKADDDAVAAADEANDRHVQARGKARRPRAGAAKGSSGRNKRVARPNRGNWKNQF